MTSVENGADTQQGADVEAGNDTDDLDALLASYSKDEDEPSRKPEKPEPKPNGQDDMPAWAREIQDKQKQIEDGLRLQNQQSALEESVRAMKKVAPELKKLPNDWLEDRLIGRADRDPRILTAFSRRKIDPGGWKKVLNGMAKKMASDLTVDEKGEDVEAVAAAARGVSTRRSDEEEAKKVSKMNSAEFAAYERQMAAQRH